MLRHSDLLTGTTNNNPDCPSKDRRETSKTATSREKFNRQEGKAACFTGADPGELPGVRCPQRNLPKSVSCPKPNDISRKRLDFKAARGGIFHPTELWGGVPRKRTSKTSTKSSFMRQSSFDFHHIQGINTRLSLTLPRKTFPSPCPSPRGTNSGQEGGRKEREILFVYLSIHLFICHTCGMHKFPDQGWNPRHG